MNALWALAAFAMTLAGGAFAFRYQRYLLYIMAFSSGLLIGVVFLDLLPEVADASHLYALNIRALMGTVRSEEHTSELQSRQYLVCRLLLEKKQKHICYSATELITP